MSNVPTQELYRRLNEAFEHFNDALFDGDLPPVIITVQRGMRTRGQFSKERWAAKDGARAHEIAINPAHLASNPLLELFQTIVREQVHCWQACFGNPSRRGYQNAEFRDKMRELGLQTSDSGEPGGREVGQNLRDYPIKNGRFLRAAAELIAEKNWVMPWIDRECRASASKNIAPWALVDPVDNEADQVVMSSDASDHGHALRADDPLLSVDDGGDIVISFDDANIETQPSVSSVREGEDSGGADADAPLRALAQSMPDVEPEVITTLVGARMADLLPDTAGIEIKEAASPKAKAKSKVKYECACGTKVWGKAGLSICCNACNEDFTQDVPNVTSGDAGGEPPEDHDLAATAQTITARAHKVDEMQAFSLDEALEHDGVFDDEEEEDALAAEDDD